MFLGQGGGPFRLSRILLMRNTRPVRGVSLLRARSYGVPVRPNRLFTGWEDVQSRFIRPNRLFTGWELIQNRFSPLTRYVFQGEHYSGIVMRVLAKGIFRVVKFFLSVFLYTFAALL